MMLTASPNGKFLYSTDVGDVVTPQKISGFQVDPVTGVLSPTPNSPYSAGVAVNSISFPPLAGMQFHPTLNVALVNNPGDAKVYTYLANPTTGELSAVLPATIPGGWAIGTMNAANNLFYSSSISGTVGVYSFDGVGAASLQSSASNSKQGGSVMTDPAGKFLYSFNGNSSDISVYSISAVTGALSEVTGSPFPVNNPSIPTMGTFERSGKFLYVLDLLAVPFLGVPNPPFPVSNKIHAFVVNTSSGAIYSVGAPLDFGSGTPVMFGVLPNGKFLVAVSGVGVSVASIDPGTGELSSVTGSPFASGMLGTVSGALLDPSGKYIYATDSIAKQMHVFSVNDNTGSVTLLGSYAVGDGAGMPTAVGLQ